MGLADPSEPNRPQIIRLYLDFTFEDARCLETQYKCFCAAAEHWRLFARFPKLFTLALKTSVTKKVMLRKQKDQNGMF
jgi:hypothetical protein